VPCHPGDASALDCLYQDLSCGPGEAANFPQRDFGFLWLCFCNSGVLRPVEVKRFRAPHFQVTKPAHSVLFR
jgi:hypothetical protein